MGPELPVRGSADSLTGAGLFLSDTANGIVWAQRVSSSILPTVSNGPSASLR
jgi:hypothetical protein